MSIFEASTLPRGRNLYWKPKTNADRIRAMSDEELAEWIPNQGVDCAYCRIESLCYEECKCGDCKEAWLIWLKREAGGIQHDASGQMGEDK